jgi:hypothetical protein
MFRDGCCSIYAVRPQVCRRYECALLKRCLGGEIALEQALRVVGLAQQQLGIFRGRAPDAVSFMRWLKAMEAAADAAGDDDQPTHPALADPVAASHITALLVYLTRHFGENENSDSAGR